MDTQAGKSAIRIFDLTEAEIKNLQNYLRNKFGNDSFRLVDRIKSTDSVEVYLGEEFIGDENVCLILGDNK